MMLNRKKKNLDLKESEIGLDLIKNDKTVILHHGNELIAFVLFDFRNLKELELY